MVKKKKKATKWKPIKDVKKFLKEEQWVQESKDRFPDRHHRPLSWTNDRGEWARGYYGRHYGDDVTKRTYYIRDRTDHRSEPQKYLREAICVLGAIQVLVLTYLVF